MEEEIDDINQCIETLENNLSPILQAVIEEFDMTIYAHPRESGSPFSVSHPYDFVRLAKRE